MSVLDYSLELVSLNHTRSAEASHTMAEMKLNASAAFHRPHELLWMMPPQYQIDPQFSLWIASTNIPNAANQAKEMMTSTV